MAVRRWVLWVGGVAIVLVFLFIAAAIVGVSWISSHTQVAETTATSASDAFAAVEKTFAGRGALIEVENERPRLNTARTALPTSTQKLTSLHVLVWAKKDSKLVRLELPFWLLKMKSKPIEFGAYASGLDDVGMTMTAEELERYGPGIVVNMSPPSGERVLLWVD